MTDLAPDRRVDPPLAGDEPATLAGFLDYLRGTIEIKTDGLDAAALATTLPPSTMTLGGLLKHLAFVEDYWLVYLFAGQDSSEALAAVDWDADPDWDWHSAAADSPDALRSLWAAGVERSRALSDGIDLGTLSVRTRQGERVSLRYILTHLIEEYARHCGHADLLRENIDGVTGE